MRSKTDQQSLIEQASHDPQAFAALYDRYVEQIFLYALRRTGERVLAEDVTSATFEKALRHLQSHGWKGKNYKSWLYMIASQQIIEHHRRNERYIALPADMAATIDVEGLAQDTLQWEQILQTMGKLSQKDQEIISLRLIERLSNTETAEFLRCSPQNVSVRLYRALGRLRNLLGATSASEGEKDDDQQ
jgi:RNA polymerase sigma-70 factor (ECF subfamily)